MRKLALFFAAAVVFSLVAFEMPKDDKDVTGNGDVITTTRSVSSFSKIKVEGVFNIYFLQGDEELVEVETDENLQDLVSVRMENGRLVVSTHDDINIKSFTKNNIYITIVDVDKIDISSVGKIECKDMLILDRLTLDYDGVGKTVLNLNCGHFNADIASVGSLTVKGKAKSANIEHSGVGSLSAFGFKVDYLSLTHSGIGSVEAYANIELSISSNGIGSVRYKGPAEVTDLNTSGLGSVRRVD